jgi:predicted phage gp36 major capsid-like protein
MDLTQVPYLGHRAAEHAVAHARLSWRASLDRARAYNRALLGGTDRVGGYERWSRLEAVRAMAAAAVWRGLLAEHKARLRGGRAV